MKKHPNTLAYSSYEIFDNSDREEIYRISKLKSCNKQLKFLLAEFQEKKISIIELGSGNSKFLINLNNHNVLETGWGVEISETRHNFAQKWVDDLGIKNVININSDIIGFDYDSISYVDVCYCVDLCFQFLEPMQKNSDVLILEKVYEKLKSGGKIILELDYCSYIIKNLPYTNKIWEEFPEDDPWAYSLWDCQYNTQDKILNWKKTLISRKNEYETTSIFLKIYSKEDIVDIMNKVGFKNIRVYKDWDYTPFVEDLSEFIIIGEK